MNWTKGVVYRLRMNLGIFNQHWLLPTSEAMSKSTFHIGNQNLFANICSVLELSKRVKRLSRVSQLLIDTWIPSIRVSAEISIGYWLPLQGFVSCFFKMGQFRPLFCLFSSFSHYNFNNTKLKKHIWWAWDSNPGPQDGRRRNHGALASAQRFRLLFADNKSYLCIV